MKRLEKMKLSTLSLRGEQDDVIETFKILTGAWDMEVFLCCGKMAEPGDILGK